MHSIRMKIEDLKISRKEYLNILKNRGIKVSNNISTDKLLRKVKFLKKLILDILQILEALTQPMICLLVT